MFVCDIAYALIQDDSESDQNRSKIHKLQASQVCRYAVTAVKDSTNTHTKSTIYFNH